MHSASVPRRSSASVVASISRDRLRASLIPALAPVIALRRDAASIGP
jgi:hypothetical protein